MDRNSPGMSTILYIIVSLSARRVWIEIPVTRYRPTPKPVALRKESVDRNLWWGVRKAVGSLSLSARRVWIEIPALLGITQNDGVALRKESVDRNLDTMQIVVVIVRRSPQGECG